MTRRTIDMHLSRRTILKGMGVAASAGLLPSFGFAQTAKAPLAAFFGEGALEAGAGIQWAHGLNLALTGTGAAIGQAMTQGAQVAADLALASGGPEITLKLNDHQGGLVPASVTGVRRLISQEGVKSLGTSYGPASEALFPLVANSGITTFWSGGAGPGGLNKQNVWVTMALFAVDPATGGLAYLAKRFPDAKNLALVGQQENGIGAVKEIAPKVWPQVSGGGTVLDAEYVNIGTTDFSALVARLKSAKADAIFTTIYGNDQGYMIRQLREAGLSIPILSIDLATPTVPDIAGDAVADNCFLAVDGYLPESDNPYNKIFVDTYSQKYGTKPDYFAANFFEATAILAALIARAKKAGKNPEDPGVLSEVLAADPSFPSVYGGSASGPGVMTFNPEDHSVSKPIGVFEIGAKGVLKKVATITKDSTELGDA
ncbi:ABC transporter substrate-binding protein [Shinella sp.]|uniref:ABC transporter substrate-binding protein n=1 Tax=Shinella sp. TaxID=1870904 RepID=UPI0029A67AEC|nr:ABC transporter substrate-binding protein [Shinella sp.]MDX3978602.1 ABC transporter substrate-binding protein [Shinella sp.]